MKPNSKNVTGKSLGMWLDLEPVFYVFIAIFGISCSMFSLAMTNSLTPIIRELGFVSVGILSLGSFIYLYKLDYDYEED